MTDLNNYRKNKLMEHMFDNLTSKERKASRDMDMKALEMATDVIDAMDAVTIDRWNMMSEGQKEDLDITEFTIENISNLMDEDEDYIVYGKAIMLVQVIMSKRLEELTKASQGGRFNRGSDAGKLFVEFMNNAAVFLAMKNIKEALRDEQAKV